MVQGLVGKTDFIKLISDGLPGGTDKFPHASRERVISDTYLEQLREDGIITRLNPFYHRSFPRVSSEEAIARLEYSMTTLRIFAEAGVKIVAGSDVAIAMSRPGATLRKAGVPVAES